jgi:hypothetical protein
MKIITLYLKLLITGALESERKKLYGLIHLLFLNNANYRSERKVTQRSSTFVNRKLPETSGRHFPESIPTTTVNIVWLSDYTQERS